MNPPPPSAGMPWRPLVLAAMLALPAPAPADRAASTIVLDEAGILNLGLETVPAEEMEFEETVAALGRLRVLPGKRAVISSRIAGRAVAVPAYPDRAVVAGEPLVVVESRQPGDPPPQITLVAPMDGLVAELAIAPGEAVQPERPLLAVLDLSGLHAIAEVPEHFVGRIRRDQPVRLTVPAYPGRVWEAYVEHLGATMDEASSTLEVAAHVANPGLRLRPGMRAGFEIVAGVRSNVLAIPRAAMQGDGAERFVFIRDYELANAFVKTPVVTGAHNGTFVEVVQGLFPGDEVVTRGAYALGFAGRGSVSLKEALDAAHGHPHNEDGSEMTAEQMAAAGAGGHDHTPAAGGWTPFTWFLAGTTLLLAMLLASGSALRRKPAADRPEADSSTARSG